MQRTLIATHPTEGALYQDDAGQYYHVAPDGTQTAVELEEDDETAFSEIGSAIFEHVDDDPDGMNEFLNGANNGFAYTLIF